MKQFDKRHMFVNLNNTGEIIILKVTLQYIAILLRLEGWDETDSAVRRPRYDLCRSATCWPISSASSLMSWAIGSSVSSVEDRYSSRRETEDQTHIPNASLLWATRSTRALGLIAGIRLAEWWRVAADGSDPGGRRTRQSWFRSAQAGVGRDRDSSCYKRHNITLTLLLPNFFISIFHSYIFCRFKLELLTQFPASNYEKMYIYEK